MAAITENSVVAALAEVRRVAEERKRLDQQARRQAEERKRREDEARRQAALVARDLELQERSGVIDSSRSLDSRRVPGHGMDPAPRMAHGWAPPHTNPAWAGDMAMERPAAFSGVADRLQPRSSFRPVLLVTLLLVGAGAFGYRHLDTQFQAALHAKNVQLVEAQTALSAAQRETAAVTARASEEAKRAVVACDGRVRDAVAEQQKLMTTLETAAPPPSSRNVARAAASSKKVDVKEATKVSSKSSSKKSDVARRRKFNDDPLGGLKLD